jgi:hypothetical protein
MLDELKPIVRQLDETYEALRLSLNRVTDDQLGWSPGGDTLPLAVIAQHIARGNITYASVIGPQRHPRWEYEDRITRTALMERVDQSQRTAHETLDGVTREDLHVSRADDWSPNCEEQLVQGPLDALWFAMQINLYLRMLGVHTDG